MIKQVIFKVADYLIIKNKHFGLILLEKEFFMEKLKHQTKKQLSSRHITMLALGGAIGAGLFKGSGEAIGIAGPSVLIAF